MPHSQHTRPHHVAAAKDREIASIGERAVEVVTEAASVAQSKGKSAASSVQKLVREHPLASLGIALSGGVLIGAVGHRLFEHKPTFGEALAARLGLDRLRTRVRHAL